MKIIIIGASITGLYLGYLLKNINVDFEIYEKNNKIETKKSNLILPYHYQIQFLLKRFKLIPTLIKTKHIYSIDIIDDEKHYLNLLIKIQKAFDKENPKNISANTFIQTVLSVSEYNSFIRRIFTIDILENEISDFMKYLFYDLNPFNNLQCTKTKGLACYNNILSINRLALKVKLAKLVQEKINYGRNVQEISYMPITNSYLLRINGELVQADKLVIATDASIQKIYLGLPKEILSAINNIKAKQVIKIYTYHKESIKLDKKIITQTIITDIEKVNDKKLSFRYVGTDDLSQYTKSELIDIFSKLLKNIISIDDIIDIKIKINDYAIHINKNKIRSNFWDKYNLILAGEWIHPYHEWLESSILSTELTFDIIRKDLYFDKLKHSKDNVKSIEDNRIIKL